MQTLFLFNYLHKIIKWPFKRLQLTALGKLCSKWVEKFAIISLVNLIVLQHSHASTGTDIGDQIMDTLTSLTCETQGVGDLLSSEFSHTCIPAPFFTFAIANLVAPLTYANTILRLKINDDELFPNACGRDNRIDPNDQKLSFAICSNIKLQLKRLEAIPGTLIAIADAMLTGEDPWGKIKDSWSIPKREYHIMRENKVEGDSGVEFDAGIPPIIPWKVIKENDRMCVATTTITFGWIPVGCKYIREPYPQSIYSDFMDLTPSGNPPINTDDVIKLTKCSGAGGGCFQRAYNNSKTGIVISAPIIECIKEMVARLLVSNDVCSFDNVAEGVASGTINRNTSTLFTFQKNMHRFVTAFLAIYVVFYGIKIVLGSGPPPKAEFFNFIFKIVFVTYFSIGITINGAGDRLDGMVQWVVPTLLDALEQLASWVMAASPSELCTFKGSDYNTGFAHIALWDSLDCKVSHYLGLDMLRTMMVENMARNHDFASFDFFSFSVPPYYYLLIPAVISGNMTLVSLALMYPLLVLSVAAYLVNSTVVCIIAIIILSVLAPLFVPMLLFNYTKGYFDAWVDLMLSFVLQPMVVVTFMITMFAVYDFGFYGKCKYTSQEIGGDAISGSRRVKIFFIDNDWGTYASEDDIKSCRNSLGFMLNNPLAALYDFSKDNANEMAGKPNIDTDKHMSNYSFLDAMSFGPAMLFISPKLVYEKIKDLILALVTACFTLYLMYHFSAQLAEFAADMTRGVSLTNVSIKPQAIFKAGMAAIGAVGKKVPTPSGDTSNIGRPGLSTDTASIGSTSSDSASIGSEGSSDAASIGSSGSGDSASIGGIKSSGSARSSSSSSFQNPFSKISNAQSAANVSASSTELGAKSYAATNRPNQANTADTPKIEAKHTVKEINKKVQEQKDLQKSQQKARSAEEKIQKKEAKNLLKAENEMKKQERMLYEDKVKQKVKAEERARKEAKQAEKDLNKEKTDNGKSKDKSKSKFNFNFKKNPKEKPEEKKKYPKEKHPGREDGTIKSEYGVTKLEPIDKDKKAFEEVGKKYDPTKDKNTKEDKGSGVYDPTNSGDKDKMSPPSYDSIMDPKNKGALPSNPPPYNQVITPINKGAMPPNPPSYDFITTAPINKGAMPLNPPPYDPSTAPKNLNALVGNDKNTVHPTKGKGQGDSIVEGYGVTMIPRAKKGKPSSSSTKGDKNDQ